MRLGEQTKLMGNDQVRESLAMLKLLAQSQQSVEGGKHKPVKKAFADLAARAMGLSQNISRGSV